MRKKLWNAINAVMLVAFLFSIAVQYNDPDPVRWMLIYGAAAVACILEMLRRTHWLYPGAIALIAFIWAGRIHHSLPRGIHVSDLFRSFEMADIGIEQAREMGGLLIVGLWMIAVSIAVQLRERSGTMEPVEVMDDDDDE